LNISAKFHQNWSL